MRKGTAVIVCAGAAGLGLITDRSAVADGSRQIETRIEFWFEKDPSEPQSLFFLVSANDGTQYVRAISLQSGPIWTPLYCVCTEIQSGSPLSKIHLTPFFGFPAVAHFRSLPQNVSRGEVRFGSGLRVANTNDQQLGVATAGGCRSYDLSGQVTLLVTASTEVTIDPGGGGVPLPVQSRCEPEATTVTPVPPLSDGDTYSLTVIEAGSESRWLGVTTDPTGATAFTGYDSTNPTADPMTADFEMTVGFGASETAVVCIQSVNIGVDSGDVDADGDLDCGDLLVLRQELTTNGTPLTSDERVAVFDFDGDGDVDVEDLMLFRSLLDLVVGSCTLGDSGDDNVLGVCDLYELRDIISAGSVTDSDPSYVVSLDMDLDGDLDTADESLHEEHLMEHDITQPGDLNCDYAVTVADTQIFFANFGTTSGATPKEGDLDGDGDVDIADWAVFAVNYGAGTGPCQ